MFKYPKGVSVVLSIPEEEAALTDLVVVRRSV
jgi:hypothetical protein